MISRPAPPTRTRAGWPDRDSCSDEGPCTLSDVERRAGPALHADDLQPTLANRVWAVLGCMKELVRLQGAAVRSGVAAFRWHRRAVLADRAATSPALYR